MKKFFIGENDFSKHPPNIKKWHEISYNRDAQYRILNQADPNKYASGGITEDKKVRYYLAGPGNEYKEFTDRDEYEKARKILRDQIRLNRKKVTTSPINKISITGTTTNDSIGNPFGVVGTNQLGAVFGIPVYDKRSVSLGMSKIGNFIDKIASVHLENYKKTVGPGPMNLNMGDFKPGKSYMSGLAVKKPLTKESKLIRDRLAYDEAIRKGTYKSTFSPVAGKGTTYHRMPVSDIANTELKKALVTSKNVPNWKYTTKKGVSGRGISNMDVDNQGANDLTISKNFNNIIKRGYLQQYYSVQKNGEQQFEAAKRKIDRFTKLTNLLQKVRNSRDRAWLSPNKKIRDAYIELENAQRRSKLAAMPQYYIGMDFRKKSILSKYGDKNNGAFGPLAGRAQNLLFSKSFKKAQQTEKVIGSPALSKTQINKLITGLFNPTATTNVSSLGLGENVNASDMMQVLKSNMTAQFKSIFAKFFKAKETTAYTKHGGGLIPKSGPYYMEGGEVVIPKKISSEDSTSLTSILNNSTNKASLNSSKLDLTELSKELKKAMSDVGKDISDKIKDTDLTVSLKEEDKEIKLDVKEAASTLADKTKSAIEGSEVKINVPEDLTVKVDADLAGSTIAEHLKTAAESVSFPKLELADKKVDLNTDSLNNITVTAKLDKDTVRVENNNPSVGADTFNNIVEQVGVIAESLVNLADDHKTTKDKIVMLNTDLQDLSKKSVDYNTAQQIAKENVDQMVGKITIDLNNVATSADASRSELEQLKGRVSYIDEKYERTTNLLKNQTHALI